MNPSAADRLVLRALANGPEGGLCLAALHGAVAVDPASESLQTFVAEISAALVRLLMSGDVTVDRESEHLVYRLRDRDCGHGAAVA